MVDNEPAGGADERERQQIEAQLRAGERLTTGPVGKVLRIGRTKTHELLRDGKIGYTKLPGGRTRLCNPEDVLRLLEESRQEHRGADGGQADG